MLEMTQTAIDVIKHLAPGDSGLRVFTSGGDRDMETLHAEIADEPRADDKVLDAVQDEGGVHLAVSHQHPPGNAPGEAGG